MLNYKANQACVLLCFLSLGVTQGAEREIFQEEFTYSSSEQMEAIWESVTSLGGKPIDIGTNVDVASAPYAKIGNVIVANQLPETVRTDWKLTFQMLHTKAVRDAWVGLFDSDGKNGYTVVWRSGPPGTTGLNNGVVAIEKFQNINWSGKDAWHTRGEKLTEYANPGHISTELPLARFELSWSHQTGTLTLSVDGQDLASTQDHDITDFSRIMIRGNGTVLFDSLVLSVE